METVEAKKQRHQDLESAFFLEWEKAENEGVGENQVQHYVRAIGSMLILASEKGNSELIDACNMLLTDLALDFAESTGLDQVLLGPRSIGENPMEQIGALWLGDWFEEGRQGS